jgi:hypothetical protein
MLGPTHLLRTMPGQKINKSKNHRQVAIVTHAGVALLSVLVLSGCSAGLGDTTSNPGTTFGKIYVDTPEVYSRERLVNDRFQQDAWLREKLKEKPKQGLQGSVGTSSQTNTSFGLGLALPSGNSSNASEVPMSPPKPPKAQLEKSAALKDVKDTPIEELRDAMAYREEVRNEILENQLDDRHDIAGNTLYRLKFDATVLPQNDTSAYAMVEVEIAGPSSSDMGGRGQALSEGNESREERELRTDLRVPDWRNTKFVQGLDKTSINYYIREFEKLREYLNLSSKILRKDSNVRKYTEDDIVYGKLKTYFEVEVTDGSEWDEAPGEIVEKDSCEYYQEKDNQEKGRKALIARDVPLEYIDIREMEEGTNGIHRFPLCIRTGLAIFISELRSSKPSIYTYAVTPKERVQRIYGDTLAAGSLGVAVAAETAGLGATLGHSNSREARANAIMRQPQVVGYSAKSYRSGNATLSGEATRSGETTMGWLIGPRYKISSDPNAVVSFRHVPSQHTLTGIISVPSWWTELKLTTKTYWLDENGVEFTVEGDPLMIDAETGSKATIALPGDSAGILDILDPKRRLPKVDSSKLVPDQLRACEPGSVIIRGTQLWRSTVVTLGAQQADSISVLPNMKGIIATFKPVKPSLSDKQPLYLWTSEGEAFVGDISISGECSSSQPTS